MASPAIGTGTGNVQTSSSTSQNTATTSTPTNAATNDLLVMVVTTNGSRTITASGWTSIGAIDAVGSGGPEMWWRLHDGSSSYAATWTSNTGYTASIVLVTGADTSSPVDVSDTYASGGLGTAQTAPSVTTTVADTLLLNVYYAGSNRTWTPASSQTEVAEIGVGTSPNSHELTKLDVASTGATGTKTSTCSASTFWASLSVAIKPAPAATATTSMIL